MKTITKSIIIATIILVATIVSTYIIVGIEVKEAMNFCNESAGNNYTFSSQNHYCNGNRIIKVLNLRTNREYWRYANLTELIRIP